MWPHHTMARVQRNWLLNSVHRDVKCPHHSGKQFGRCFKDEAHADRMFSWSHSLVFRRGKEIKKTSCHTEMSTGMFIETSLIITKSWKQPSLQSILITSTPHPAPAPLYLLTPKQVSSPRPLFNSLSPILPLVACLPAQAVPVCFPSRFHTFQTGARGHEHLESPHKNVLLPGSVQSKETDGKSFKFPSLDFYCIYE